jgi:hypothetical protein
VPKEVAATGEGAALSRETKGTYKRVRCPTKMIQPSASQNTIVLRRQPAYETVREEFLEIANGKTTPVSSRTKSDRPMRRDLIPPADSAGCPLQLRQRDLDDGATFKHYGLGMFQPEGVRIGCPAPTSP